MMNSGRRKKPRRANSTEFDGQSVSLQGVVSESNHGGMYYLGELDASKYVGGMDSEVLSLSENRCTYIIELHGSAKGVIDQ